MRGLLGLSIVNKLLVLLAPLVKTLLELLIRRIITLPANSER